MEVKVVDAGGLDLIPALRRALAPAAGQCRQPPIAPLVAVPQLQPDVVVDEVMLAAPLRIGIPEARRRGARPNRDRAAADGARHLLFHGGRRRDHDFLDHFLGHDPLDHDFLDHFLGDHGLDRDFLDHFLRHDPLDRDFLDHFLRHDLRFTACREHGRAGGPEEPGSRALQKSPPRHRRMHPTLHDAPPTPCRTHGRQTSAACRSSIDSRSLAPGVSWRACGGRPAR